MCYFDLFSKVCIFEFQPAVKLLDLFESSGVCDRDGRVIREQTQPSRFFRTQLLLREHSQNSENLLSKTQWVTDKRPNSLSMQPVIASNPLAVAGRVQQVFRLSARADASNDSDAQRKALEIAVHSIPPMAAERVRRPSHARFEV